MNKQCIQRLQKEYMKIQKDPIPEIICKPLTSNILEWHYVIYDIKDEKSPYYGGIYHGKVVFSPDYPFKPPSIFMITPNGRFQTNTRLCLSMSDFHPESWNPMWSISSILTGLYSFMMEDKSTYGSIETSDDEKRAYAKKSHETNSKNKIFTQLFPEIKEFLKKKEKEENKIVEKKDEEVMDIVEDSMPWSSWFLQLLFLFLFCAFVVYISL